MNIVSQKAPKALVITGIPFSYSNRGIDIITQALVRMGYETTHLTFAPKRTLNQHERIHDTLDGLEQKTLEMNPFSYAEKVMGNWPDWAVRLVNKHTLKSIDFDFSEYDLIIIESGKPVMLLPLIPKSAYLIYRQSDPMVPSYRSSVMLEAEHKVIQRANKIICVRDYPNGNLLYGEDESNVSFIANGFDPGHNMDTASNNLTLNSDHKKNAIYVGYARISGELLCSLAEKNKDVIFHIVGECLPPKQIKHVREYPNIKLYGNLKSKEYLPMVYAADIAIVPYEWVPGTDYLGMTSKNLTFMHAGLPIVSMNIGCKNEFPPSEFISFNETYDDFLDSFSQMLHKAEKPVSYDIDFDSYSKEGRIHAYMDYFRKIELP